MSNSKRFQKSYSEDSPAAVATEEPSEPSDEELLRDFRSHYSQYDPNQVVHRGADNPSRKASEPIELERAAFLRQRRAQLAEQRAQAERSAQQQAQQEAALEAAFRLHARTRLADAVRGYNEWQAKAEELRASITERESTLAGLLASQSSETGPETLKKQTALVADCRLIADALKARLSAWMPREKDYLNALQEATSAAKSELAILHQHERHRRLKESMEKIEAIIDLQHLRDGYYRQRFGGGSLPELAESSHAVIALDKTTGYMAGRYPWHTNPHQFGPELLVLATQLESFYTNLVPLLREG
jgi:hypothetical protein